MKKLLYILIFVSGFLFSSVGRTAITEVYHSQDCDGRELMIVAVETSVYEALTAFPEFDRYIVDVESERKYAISVVTVESVSSLELQQYLYSKLSEGLAGVLFIGDLPVVEFENSDDFNGHYARFPMDLFYMDLDGEWLDADNDGRYDSHGDGTGDHEPDIWLGRLTSSTVSVSGMDEVGLIRNYLTKNHNYRIGQLTLDHKAMVMHQHDWHYWDELDFDLVYSDTDLVTENVVGSLYRTALTENYELIHISVHSSALYHAFSGSRVYSHEIPTIDPTTFFYSLYACTNCKYTTTNYMGGHYIFAPTYGLVAVGSTKVGGMLNYGTFNTKLKIGVRENMGEAFKNWFGYNSAGYLNKIRWFYGMTMLGDPTLSVDIPIAKIDPLVPASSTRGEELVLNGSGIINEGTIVDYLWQSDLDGYLGSDQSLSVYFLSEGTHTISFQVKDNTDRWSTVVTKQIVIELALTTVLVSPKGHIETVHPNFRWHNDGTYSSYELKVSESDNDDNIVLHQTGITESNWIVPENDGSLLDGKSYNWWVRGIGDPDNESFQGPKTFNILLQPSLELPVDGEIWISDLNGFSTFQWAFSYAPYQYELVVYDKDNDDFVVVHETEITGNVWFLSENDGRLEFGRHYGWKVGGAINGESTNWSEPGSFILIYDGDTTAPVTTHDFDNDNEWINFNADITFSATDDINGVKEIKYRVNDGVVVVTHLLSLSEGIYDVEYWSIDNAGNEEVHKSFDVLIDTTPPETTDDFEGGEFYDGGGSGGNDDLYPVFYPPINITLTASDNLSGVNRTMYRVNNYSQNGTLYGEPDGPNQNNDPVEGTEISIDEPGEYSCEYWSIDNAGNEGWHGYVSVTVVENYVPYLVSPVYNVADVDWGDSLKFKWIEKLEWRYKYTVGGRGYEIRSVYVYEIKVYEEGDNDTILASGTDLSGGVWSVADPETVFQEGKTYKWMMRSKYQYDYQAGEWSDNWSTKTFKVVDRNLALVTLNDNDSVSMSWDPFADGTLYRIDSTRNIKDLEWNAVDSTDVTPLNVTDWMGGEWMGVSENCYRVVGVVPHIESVSPGSVAVGSQSFAVEIIGGLTGWAGDVSVDFGAGISVDSAVVEDEGSVIVIIDVDNDAELGNRAVTLIHDNDAYVKEDVLEVVP